MQPPEDERAVAARSLAPTPGLEGLAQLLGVTPEKAPVGPLSSDQPLPGKKTRGRRDAAPKAKPAKKRGRRT